MDKDIDHILYDEQQLRSRITQLGAQLSEMFDEKNPLVICVLKGAFIFMADLVKCMPIALEIDFLVVSSYGKGSKTSGSVKINKDLDISVTGRDVIVVEDIIDSGVTLSHLKKLLLHRQAGSVTIVSLFDKPSRRTAQIEADFVGFSIPDEFIVGYGLDYAERYRNLPYVGVLKPELYTD
jgi:hypoxanthine phosphoribosyltransferase